ncbi:hypothetical protein ACQW02_09735 [Humitalea sp. 24SJ18S-53]|uniref:hypothetical protein n=1 Tax=Humitalea sp. 24SJ18S-53 TaxID=3422307 RepID=UPI003D6786E3
MPDYVHELAMFPKGRRDDQVDSTAQALAYISQPTGAEGLLDYMRGELLRAYNLSPDDLTIVFDHQSQSTQFTVRSGRQIVRASDGFYQVTPQEWEELKYHHGVTLVEDLRAKPDVE